MKEFYRSDCLACKETESCDKCNWICLSGQSCDNCGKPMYGANFASYAHPDVGGTFTCCMECNAKLRKEDS